MSIDTDTEAREVSRHLQTIAREIQERLVKLTGREDIAFSLFVWSRGRSNYISTADRKEVAAVMVEHLKGWRKGMPDIPAHEVE